MINAMAAGGADGALLNDSSIRPLSAGQSGRNLTEKIRK